METKDLIPDYPALTESTNISIDKMKKRLKPQQSHLDWKHF